MKKFKRFKKAFGLNEFEMIDFPTKISRIKIGKESGCSWCFPHGYETINCTKPQRNWKSQRKLKWKKEF